MPSKLSPLLDTSEQLVSTSALISWEWQRRSTMPESAEVLRLRFVSRGWDFGFSLDEIRSLLALADDESLACDEVDRVARHHLEEIRTRVRELNRMAKELERTIRGSAGGRRAQCAILDALRAPSASRTGRTARVHV